MEKEFCFICGKEIKGIVKSAYSQDDNQALHFVGPNCYKEIVKSGKDGYAQKMKFGMSGPKLFETKELAYQYSITN